MTRSKGDRSYDFDYIITAKHPCPHDFDTSLNRLVGEISSVSAMVYHNLKGASWIARH